MEEAEGIRDRFHLVAGLRFHIGVKERFADDGECQRGHVIRITDEIKALEATTEENNIAVGRGQVGHKRQCIALRQKNRIKSSWGRGDETEMSPRYS